MKILKIKATGLPLFNGDCEISFISLQRMVESHIDNMGVIFSSANRRYFQNNVMSYIGINASGKTTVLKLISFVCSLLNNIPLNISQGSEIFDGLEKDSAVFDIYFYSNGKINWLNVIIGKENGRLFIKDETLKSKSARSEKVKKDLFNFDGADVVLVRDSNSEFLLEDLSIMVGYNKRNSEQLSFVDMLQYTNNNLLDLDIADDCPPELIAFFDSNIEYLRLEKVKKDTVVHLKFKGKPELLLHRISDLNRYLSSGTIKGINTFLKAFKVFKTGGYLIIDELENHFNHEIVSTFIRFFMDKKINPNGAMLIFSTHYAELLDEFERNDNVNIVRNRNGIVVQNLSDLLQRTDIKKSDIYQSDFLGGTAPAYDSYMNLKNSLRKLIEVNNNETV